MQQSLQNEEANVSIKDVEDEIAFLAERIVERQKRIAYFAKRIGEIEHDVAVNIQGNTAEQEQIVEHVEHHDNVAGQQAGIVPGNLPMFKVGGDRNDNTVIVDVEEFVDRFERILRAYNLELNAHWRRLLPLSCGKVEAHWVERCVVHRPEIAMWQQARVA